MNALSNFVAGLLFGIGLVISGMVNPAKVTNFLDIAGQWDPSLALVMAGAVGVAAAGYMLVQRRAAPVFAPQFELPSTTGIDQRLVSGAAIFGIGWGLYGFCPGPAITSLMTGGSIVWIFVAAMFAGAASANHWRAR